MVWGKWGGGKICIPSLDRNGSMRNIRAGRGEKMGMAPVQWELLLGTLIRRLQEAHRVWQMMWSVDGRGTGGSRLERRR